MNGVGTPIHEVLKVILVPAAKVEEHVFKHPVAFPFFWLYSEPSKKVICPVDFLSRFKNKIVILATIRVLEPNSTDRLRVAVDDHSLVFITVGQIRGR